ncbi:hypothetical protein C8Q76DRAFT_70325 [Earliella scabrosa]|nr:hypothetical protein C8Q76DRAFT_70325 [Earliella scabrosa]
MAMNLLPSPASARPRYIPCSPRSLPPLPPILIRLPSVPPSRPRAFAFPAALSLAFVLSFFHRASASALSAMRYLHVLVPTILLAAQVHSGNVLDDVKNDAHELVHGIMGGLIGHNFGKRSPEVATPPPMPLQTGSDFGGASESTVSSSASSKSFGFPPTLSIPTHSLSLSFPPSPPKPSSSSASSSPHHRGHPASSESVLSDTPSPSPSGSAHNGTTIAASSTSTGVSRSLTPLASSAPTTTFSLARVPTPVPLAQPNGNTLTVSPSAAVVDVNVTMTAPAAPSNGLNPGVNGALRLVGVGLDARVSVVAAAVVGAAVVFGL